MVTMVFLTTHKFNNHSSISLFLTAWLCKLARHQCTCSHFITIAYNLIPRVLSTDEVVLLTLYVCPHSWLGFCFWKPRRVFQLLTSDFRLPTSDFRLPTSDFQLPTSDFRKIQKLFFFFLPLGKLYSRRFWLSRLFHIERSWHTYRFTVVFVSGRQDLPSDARAYSLKLFITAE